MFVIHMLSLSCLITAIHAEEFPLLVAGDYDKYVYRATREPPKNQGYNQYADGTAGSPLCGIVLDFDELHPLEGVAFKFEKTDENHSFSDLDNTLAKGVSDARGCFSIPVSVCTATFRHGEENVVFQTTKTKIAYFKDGYSGGYIMVDYKMPRIVLLIKKNKAGSR